MRDMRARTFYKVTKEMQKTYARTQQNGANENEREGNRLSDELKAPPIDLFCNLYRDCGRTHDIHPYIHTLLFSPLINTRTHTQTHTCIRIDSHLFNLMKKVYRKQKQ